MKPRRGYGYLVTVFVIWGSLYVVSKFALATIPPITLLLFRYLAAVAALALLARKVSLKPVRRADIKYFLLLGGLGYGLGIALQLIGTRLLDASLASLINAMNPVSIALMATFFLHERMTVRKIASLTISILGVYVILGRDTGSINLLGMLACVFAVLFWSAASIAIRRISGDYDPIQISLYGIILAIGVVLPASLLELRSNPCTFTLPGVLAILYLGVVCTAVSHTLWNKSLALLDASTCALFYPLQPLTSAVMGMLLLHETVTINYILGGLLISSGILVAVLRVGNRDSIAVRPAE